MTDREFLNKLKAKYLKTETKKSSKKSTSKKTTKKAQ